MCSDVVVFHPPPMSHNALRKRLHALDSAPQLAGRKRNQCKTKYYKTLFSSITIKPEVTMTRKNLNRKIQESEYYLRQIPEVARQSKVQLLRLIVGEDPGEDWVLVKVIICSS